MPADPLKPLDAINQFAPHNLIASLLSGRAISPVMARQPTLYEIQYGYQSPLETARVQPSSPGASFEPAMKSSEELTAGPLNMLLQFAPHNILTMLIGGQLPIPEPLPPSMDEIPAGVTLNNFITKKTGKVVSIDNGMGIMLNDKNAKVTITNSDRNFITLHIMEDKIIEGTKGKEWWGYTTKFEAKFPHPEGGIGEIDPTKTKIMTLGRGQSYSAEEKKGKYTETTSKRGLGGWSRTETTFRQRTFIMLIPPIAPTEKEIAARNKEIEEAKKKIPEVPVEVPEITGLSDMISDLSSKEWSAGVLMGEISNLQTQSGSYLADIGGFKSALETANATGQPPAVPPSFGSLLAGGLFLPLFSGSQQIGAASKQVQDMANIMKQANKTNESVNSLASDARDANEELQKNLQNLKGAKNSSQARSYYSAGLQNYNAVISHHKSISNLVTGTAVNSMHSLGSRAQNLYSEGIGKITAPGAPGPPTEKPPIPPKPSEKPPAPSKPDVSGLIDEALRLILEAQSLEAQGRLIDAAKKYEEAANYYRKAGDTASANRYSQKGTDLRYQSVREGQQKWEEEQKRRQEAAKKAQEERQKTAESISQQAWEWRRKIAEQKAGRK